ncbi:hypothetical protein GCM10017562_21830 [Streptomyces roseofulvus]
MVGVVEEEDQVAEAYEGVGAVPRPGEGAGVAVHVADHVDSHGPHLRASDLRLLGSRESCGLLCGDERHAGVTHGTSDRDPLSGTTYWWVTSGQSTVVLTPTEHLPDHGPHRCITQSRGTGAR